MGADAGRTRPDLTAGVGEEAEHCLEATLIRGLCHSQKYWRLDAGWFLGY